MTQSKERMKGSDQAKGSYGVAAPDGTESKIVKLFKAAVELLLRKDFDLKKMRYTEEKTEHNNFSKYEYFDGNMHFNNNKGNWEEIPSIHMWEDDNEIRLTCRDFYDDDFDEFKESNDVPTIDHWGITAQTNGAYAAELFVSIAFVRGF